MVIKHSVAILVQAAPIASPGPRVALAWFKDLVTGSEALLNDMATPCARWVHVGVQDAIDLDYEVRPTWVKCERRRFWRRMYPCRCMRGPHACRSFALPYYGYRCRLCNDRVRGEHLPRCHCRCVGCVIPAEHDPEVNWHVQPASCRSRIRGGWNPSMVGRGHFLKSQS